VSSFLHASFFLGPRKETSKPIEQGNRCATDWVGTILKLIFIVAPCINNTKLFIVKIMHKIILNCQIIKIIRIMKYVGAAFVILIVVII
jgi:hypothetical protein